MTDDKHGAPKGPTFLPCPFCGRNPDPTDPSTLHPTGTVWRDEAEFRSYHSHSERQEGDGRCWVFACLTESGGCGAEVHGDSEEEAIIAWNRRSAPSAIDSTELARLREIEHVAWHLLDDAEENAQTGDITLFRGSGDYEKLCALLPEDHPSAVTETLPTENEVLAAQKVAGLYFEIAEEVVGQDEVRRRFKEKFGEELILAEKAQRAEADADQAKDAARYRWLRDEGNNDWPSLVSAGISPPRIDAAIDAAMRETDGTHGE